MSPSEWVAQLHTQAPVSFSLPFYRFVVGTVFVIIIIIIIITIITIVPIVTAFFIIYFQFRVIRVI
jgi:hypothetical protein